MDTLTDNSKNNLGCEHKRPKPHSIAIPCSRRMATTGALGVSGAGTVEARLHTTRDDRPGSFACV